MEIQELEVISVNFWQILISLANLIILFLILKKLLFKPVKKMVEARKNEIDKQYLEAENANEAARQNQKAWDDKMLSAQSEADAIIKKATDKAKHRSNEIIEDAHADAESILRQAKSDAALEIKKADETIRREIVEVSSALSEKLLEREINKDDHKEFIDSFIESIGDSND